MDDRDRLRALGEDAWRAIDAMLREILGRRPGAHLVDRALRRIELRLTVDLSGSPDEPRRFAHALATSLEEIVDEAVEHAAAFRPGRAYCHRCGSASCEHSLPPSSRDVFLGYAPTGMPRWGDFAQHCLELKHPQVDRLFDRPPALISLVQDRDDLHGGMVDAFDDGRYELLGQVIAGFFLAPTAGRNGRDVVALTFQAATSRPRRGRRKVGLNLLGVAPDGRPLESLWEQADDMPWRTAARWAQGALGTLTDGGGARRRTERAVVRERVDGILRGLARRLVSDSRSRARRTRHAEERHASGTRPTRKAVDDARRVDAGSFFVDERSGTLVVVGDRGRTHFFTADGQHVSSVRYSRDALERKRRLEIWRPGSAEELVTFRGRLPE